MSTAPAQVEAPPAPSLRATLVASLLAALLGLAFLGSAVLPSRAVVPFAPERFLAMEPADAAAMPDDVVLGNVTMGDKYNQSLAWDRTTQEGLREGRLPLWSDRIAGGAPFVPQMAQVYQPWNLLTLLPVESAGLYGLWYLLHLIGFGVGAWWFLRRVGLRNDAALFGLTLAVLGLWTQARVHHNVILSAALPLWPLLSLCLAAFRARTIGLGRIAGVGLCLGISWSGGFAPVSLQTTGLAVLLSLVLAVATRRVLPLVELGLGGALGGVLALAQMVPTLAAAAATSRETASAEALRGYGLSAAHLLSTLWPDLLNWSLRPYHAPSFVQLDLLPPMPPEQAARFNWPETAFALGLPALALLPVALLPTAERRPRLVPTALLLVGLVALGIATAASPFLELTAVLPGARAGDLRRFLFLAHVGLLVGAAGGADVLLRSPRTALATALPIATVALFVSVVLLGAWAMPTASDAEFADAWSQRIAASVGLPGIDAAAVRTAMELRATEIADNHAHLLTTFGRGSVAGLALLLVLVTLRGGRRVLALAAVGALELVHAGAGTVVPVAVERVAEAPAVLEPVRAARSADQPARLCRLFAPDASDDWYWLLPPNLGAYYGVEDLAAYDPLPPRRMEELFLAIEPDRPGKDSAVLGGTGVRGFYDPASLSHPLLDLLGAGFVLSARGTLPATLGLPASTPPQAGPRVELHRRPTAWPRATFVDTIEVIADPAERLARLADRDHPLRTTALVENGEPQAGDGVVDATCTAVSHRPEEVVVVVETSEPGAVRLADPWDPGWTATLDGQPTDCLVADHYLRAVRVPAGRSEVVFRYDGPLAVWPRRASLAGLAVVGLLLLGSALRRLAARAQ